MSSKAIARHWPAEWAPHDGTVLFFPHNPGTFRSDRATSEFLTLAHTLAQFDERVYAFCKDDTHQTSIQQALKEALSSSNNNILVHVCESDDTWARDTAPTLAVNCSTDNEKLSKQLIGLDWGFNAYGGEVEGAYWPCMEDQKIAKKVCETLQVPCRNLHSQLILEGGSIHTDGEGTILTTKECLLNPNRNPKLSQDEIEAIVLQETGCTKMLWLEDGLAHDEDTNGHVDNFCCFVKPSHVVLAWTDNAATDSENYQRCRDALALLKTFKDAKGRSLTVHKLMLPSPMYYTQDILDTLSFGSYEKTFTFPRHVGDRMAASYVNFYIGNKVVLVPQFSDPMDGTATETLSGLFPERTVVGIPSKEILIGGGNIHCVTQQIPKISTEQSTTDEAKAGKCSHIKRDR